MTSGVLGVLFALAQHDLKRLLAYHSVENIGIIALGLGVGLLGVASGMPALAVLGFAGGLLHVVNHALFKGLLFLGAGAVLHGDGHAARSTASAGCCERMPWTGACFLVGAAAISGLPPLNGFVSEFLIYLGALPGLIAAAGPVADAGPGAGRDRRAGAHRRPGGGLFHQGVRHRLPGRAAERPRRGRARGGAGDAVADGRPGGGLRCGRALPGAGAAGRGACAAPRHAAAGRRQSPGRSPMRRRRSWMIAAAAAVLLAAVLRPGRACAGRCWRAGRWRQTVTWDCGYARPTARMQYTASSFAQPLTELFRLVLRTRVRAGRAGGPLPGASACWSRETPDVFREAVFRPAFAGIRRALDRLRMLQHGRVQLYVLYIVLTLLVLLVWKLR